MALASPTSRSAFSYSAFNSSFAFSSKVTISKDGKEVDAKRILGVMGLGVKKDQEIVLRADGDDEDAAIEKLSAFLQENL